MSDILEQINSLTEQFSNLFNEDYDTLDNASHIKRVYGNPEYIKDENGKYKRDENGFRVPANRAAKLFQKGHPKDGRTMYGDGYLGQGSGVVWTKRDNNLYDEDDNLKDSNKAVEKSIKRYENKVKKMNDNNSYNEVVSQINSLTEQFSNLFEVEGLGDPASDVPPSTNKIKKDRKTKDGKVELVSVEDELFPYDGNKREQYRQKIIDTINNMIQGTATLEDLLQIVRQKKAPLKEAMEILEELLREDGHHEKLMKKYGTDTVQKLPKEVRRKYFPTNRDEVIDGWERYKAGSKSRSHQDLNQYGPEQGKKFKINLRGEYKEPEVSGNKEDFSYIGKYEPKSDEQRTQGSIARHEKKEQKKDSLKEAMEVLENIQKQIDKKANAGEISVDKAFELEKKVQNSMSDAKKEQEREEALQDDAKKNKYSLAHSIRHHAIEGSKRRAYDKGKIANPKKWDPIRAPQTENKVFPSRNEALEEAISALLEYTEANKKEAANKVLSKRKREYLSKYGDVLDIADEVGSENVPDGNMKDLDRAEKRYEHAKKIANEGFEGAIEILEEIINEVSERTKIDAYKKRVAQHQELADRETKTANDYAKLGAYEPAINHLKKASDSQKKEFKHRLNTISHDKKFGQDAFNKAQKELYDEWKAKNNVKEGFEGAIEILEELINEVSDKTAQGALDKAKERYNRKGYEASMKLFQGDSKGAIEDGNKAQDEYNKHINMQLRRAKRQGKKLVQDKNDHDSFKIEEAQELLEEIINEVSLKKWKESAKNSYDKRKEVADKSAEADKKSWDNYEKQSKLSPEDEPELFKKVVDQGAIAYKDKKRADHAMGVYANTPDSKHSATKYNKAILNSLKGREDKYVETGKKSDLDRAINTFHLAKLNPVKEAQELSELFDRPDLLDDISKTLTNKTIKQHLENQVKKLLGGKKKKKVACKACEGLEEATTLLEEIINEVSVGMWKRAANNSIEGRKEKAENSKRNFDFINKNTSDDVSKYKTPDGDYDVDAYDRAQGNARKFKQSVKKDAERLSHAEKVSSLKLPKDNSKKSVKKFLNATSNSEKGRLKALKKTGDTKRKLSRIDRIRDIADADPFNKERTLKRNVAYKTARDIEKAMDLKDKEAIRKDGESLQNISTTDLVRKSLENSLSNNKATQQAKQDQLNAQLNQGLKKKEDK